MEERFCIEPEMARRLRGKPFTSAMIVLDEGQDAVLDIERILKVDKIKSRHLREQEDVDIKQDALTIAVEKWREPDARVSVRKSTPLPAFPAIGLIGMLPNEEKFWEGAMARAWKNGKLAVLQNHVPKFRGDKENAPEKAREGRRNKWRTIKRQSEILSDPAAQEEARRQIHERTDSKPDVSNNMLKVLRLAKKRWGPKAVIALKYCSQGKTEEEAAKLAGVTSRSVRNYKLKLEKEFSRKK
jgi:hypothetical protein